MRYKRVLLKLSGKSLSGDKESGYDHKSLLHYTNEIKVLYDQGIEVIVVVGGGNLWRGNQAKEIGLPQAPADYMGMMASMMNSIALHQNLIKACINSYLMGNTALSPMCTKYNREEAIYHLSKKRVIILGGGLGHPFFTCDTAATISAISLEAELMLKGTQVNGIYNEDPFKNKAHIHYDQITFDEVYKQNLKVMDKTAITICMEHKLPLIVYKASYPGYLKRIVVDGENLGTLVYH